MTVIRALTSMVLIVIGMPFAVIADSIKWLAEKADPRDWEDE